MLGTEIPEGHQFKGTPEELRSVPSSVCGQGSYTDDLEHLSHHVPLSRTYLPTINLIVFVQTPFKARAKDTATKQTKRQKNNQLAL